MEGFYDWVCFGSHQAAELGLKALQRGLVSSNSGVTFWSFGGGLLASVES
ncbi:HEPN domain-containing protein [Pyrolobus fumarii]|nr:HEPN domain-containing protein [Pyrolobus fumarii]